MLRWVAVGIWMGVIFTLSAIPSLASPLAPFYDFVLRKVAHMGAYAVLMGLLFRALQGHIETRRCALLPAALLTVLYALSDEWHQTFVAGRHGSFRDVGIDTLGIIGSYALLQRYAVQRVRQCPRCHGERLYRSKRRGTIGWLSRFISLSPYHCEICDPRFRLSPGTDAKESVGR
jgi:VanZ family protein